MKKKFFVCSFIALAIFSVNILTRRNRNRLSLGFRFIRPNGSHIKLRTIFKEPGQ